MGTVAVVVVGLAGAAAIAVRGGGDGGSDGDATDAATTTAEVEVRDLIVTDEYEGELGFGETDPITAGRSGVVTGLQPAGTVVGEGRVLFHLDLQPTVLIHGQVPAFRDLDVDADPGADVKQLEAGLVRLGYGDGLTVDNEFDDDTATAVEAWETALGRPGADGVVSLGDVVFAPADLRVAEVSADRGTQVQDGADVVQVTATTTQVTLQLTVDQAADVEAGAPATVTLPDRSDVAGSIADVATEPTGAEEGGGGGEDEEDTYAVTVTFDDPTVADAFESGTVEVTVERSRTTDALAVPVTALLALREGGYALEVVDGTAPTGSRLVPVETGALAGELVEVTGDGIEAGIEVVVPE